MYKNKLISLFFVFIIPLFTFAQNRVEINLPDIPGFFTMKCDFHMHTVFSDGDVWPTVRVQEAWQEGLDAIAITDHIEYRPHLQDVDSDHNRAYEIAKPLADQIGLLLIKGTEITREMPPGHLNAIFINNANLIEREGWWEACVEAKEQGAFIFWNHPGWKAQQPDTVIWWKEHTRLMNAGLLQGIEIYNQQEFYPEALKWVKEKGLTILSNSDAHGPTGLVFCPPERRPVTLVFAHSRTLDGIRQALLAKRTAAYFKEQIVGDRRYLSPLFFNSIEILESQVGLENHQVKRLLIHNNSDISFKLKQRQPCIGFSSPDEIILEAHRTVQFELNGTSEEVRDMRVLKMYYEVENLKILTGEPLPVVLEVFN